MVTTIDEVLSDAESEDIANCVRDECDYAHALSRRERRPNQKAANNAYWVSEARKACEFHLGATVPEVEIIDARFDAKSAFNAAIAGGLLGLIVLENPFTATALYTSIFYSRMYFHNRHMKQLAPQHDQVTATGAALLNEYSYDLSHKLSVIGYAQAIRAQQTLLPDMKPVFVVPFCQGVRRVIVQHFSRIVGDEALAQQVQARMAARAYSGYEYLGERLPVPALDAQTLRISDAYAHVKSEQKQMHFMNLLFCMMERKYHADTYKKIIAGDIRLGTENSA